MLLVTVGGHPWLQVGGLYFGYDQLKEVGLRLSLDPNSLSWCREFVEYFKILTVRLRADSNFSRWGNAISTALVSMKFKMSFLIAILVCLASSSVTAMATR